MNRNTNVGTTAFEYHNSGYHCAEAVLKAITEAYGNGFEKDILKVATAFGGGIGRTKQELCGALIGGFIALGHLFGRSVPNTDWTDASEMAAGLRKRFVNVYGTTTCCALLTTFGPQEDMMRCKQLSGEVAEMLADIIDEGS